MTRLAGLVAILLIALCACSACIVPPPDTVQLFTNGSIYIDAETRVDNLLVRDGVVAGWNVDAAGYPTAEVIDLRGAAAYPGFNDSHVHLMITGYVFREGVSLLGCTDVNCMTAALAEKAKTVPEGGLMIGAGFSLRDYDQWSLADLAALDQASGGHAVFLADKLGHNAIVNTAAIKLTGITPATPVPLGGKMGVEAGQLTGMLRESAMNLPGAIIFGMADDATVKTAAQQVAQRWAALGYTGIVDLMGGPGIRLMRPELYIQMEKEGSLPLRVHYTYTIFNLGDVDAAVKYQAREFNTDRVRFIGCKIFVDGAFAGGQAWTSWANEQGNHGLQQIYTDDVGGPELNLNRIVAKVEEYGMNMHYHTQGDRAIDAVLDALDKVVAEKGKLNGVHTLIHLAFPTDEQIARIKKFDGHVVTTTQPGFWPVEDDTAYYYGDRAEAAYPIKKLIDSGVSVGMSTDFSVSPPEYTPPAAIMAVATTGNGQPEMHTPLSIRDVIRGFTEGSAATTGTSDTGKLRTGYKADIVVYDKDLYQMAPEELSQSAPKVLATYVGGRKTAHP